MTPRSQNQPPNGPPAPTAKEHRMPLPHLTAPHARRAALALAAALCLAAPTPAIAGNGTYTQFLCAHPTIGEALGPRSLDGITVEGTVAAWRPALTAPATCAAGMASASNALALRPAQPATVSPGAWTALHYRLTEPGLALQSGTLYRAVRLGGAERGYMSTGQHASTDHSNPFAAPSNPADTGAWSNLSSAERGDPTRPWAPENAITLTHRNNAWTITARCDAPAGRPCTHAADQWRYLLFGGRLTLRDDAAPHLAHEPAGALADGDPTPGDLRLSASDVGSGVYRVVVYVDGREVYSQPAAPGSERCRDVDPYNANPYEFIQQVPCPHAAVVDLHWDTRSIGDGAHRVEVHVEDAGGNAVRAVDRVATFDHVPDPQAVPGAPPYIAGEPRQGAALTAAPGSWTNAEYYTYQWLRCDGNGDDCLELPGQRVGGYWPSDDDVGHRLRLVVTATNRIGESASATSPATRLIAGSATTPAPGRPSATAPPPGPGRPNPSPARPEDGPRPLANGRGADRAARLSLRILRRRTSLRTTFARAVPLHGRLTDARGNPIAGARLELSHRAQAAGATARPLGTATTSADGTFRYTARGGPSRAIAVSYRAFAGDAQVAARASIRTIVPAAVSLQVSRARVRRTTWMRGRLKHLPRGGVLIQVQALDGRRWRTFDTTMTKAAGRFRYGYRFKPTAAGRAFWLRVLASSPVYPFATGVSPPRRVIVR